MTWLVDVPNSANPDAEVWVEVAEFDTQPQAIAFTREKYGADEKGCICLVSECVTVGDDDEGRP